MLQTRCTTWAEAGTSETVRAQARQTAARTHAQCSWRPTSTNEHDDRGVAGDSMCTPRALRKVETGVDVRLVAGNEPALRTSSVGAGNQLEAQ